MCVVPMSEIYLNLVNLKHSTRLFESLEEQLLLPHKTSSTLGWFRFLKAASTFKDFLK